MTRSERILRAYARVFKFNVEPFVSLRIRIDKAIDDANLGSHRSEVLGRLLGTIQERMVALGCYTREQIETAWNTCEVDTPMVIEGMSDQVEIARQLLEHMRVAMASLKRSMDGPIVEPSIASSAPPGFFTVPIEDSIYQALLRAVADARGMTASKVVESFIQNNRQCRESDIRATVMRMLSDRVIEVTDGWMLRICESR